MKKKEAYKIVISDLRKSFGKRCKTYSMGCVVCIAHIMADGLTEILEFENEKKETNK